MATGMGIKDLNVYDDLQLVLNQLLEEFVVKKDDLTPYHKYALQLLDKLETVKLEHLPRSANKMLDVLANLAATLAPRPEESVTMSVCGQWVVTSSEDGNEVEVNTISICEIDKED